MLRCLRRDQIKLLWLRGWVLKTEEHSVVWLLNFCTGMSKPLIAGECLSSTPPSFHSHIPHWSYITEKLLPPPSVEQPTDVYQSHTLCYGSAGHSKDCWTCFAQMFLIHSTNTFTVEGCNFEKKKVKFNNKKAVRLKRDRKSCCHLMVLYKCCRVLSSFARPKYKHFRQRLHTKLKVCIFVSLGNDAGSWLIYPRAAKHSERLRNI